MSINFLAVLLVAFGGCALCRGLHLNPSARDVWTAGIVAMLSSQVALIPLVVTRRSKQADVSQAALISTVLQLLLCAAGGLAASSVLHVSHGYMYWLCAFYWATLITVAIAAVRAVKAAPMATATT